jgi:hypothetical protein
MGYDYFGRLMGQKLDDLDPNQQGFAPGAAPQQQAPGQAASPGQLAPLQGSPDPSQLTMANGSFNYGSNNAGSQGSYVPGSTFVNFGQMYRANAEKAKASASKLGNGVQSEGDAASQDINNAESGFGKAVTAGTTQYPSGKTPKAVGPGPSATGYGLSSAAGAPYGDTGSMTRDQLAAGAGATYTGPSSLGDYVGQDRFNQLGSAAQKASSDAQGLTTAEGIASQMGYGTATGKSRLDAGLAQGAGSGAFDQLSKRYGGMLGDFTNAQTASQATADEARGETDDASKLYGADLAAWDAAHPSTPAAAPNLGVNLNTQGGGLNSVQSSGAFDHPGTGGNVQLKDIQGNLDKYAPSIAQGAAQYGVDAATVRDTLTNMTAQQYAQWEADPAAFWAGIAKQKGGK